MEIRKAETSDVPEMVSLLKSSLGESLMPKSEEYWYWKHVDNPFGASPVLLACEDNQIVGVRAFMRWRWINGVKTITAIRAVDTATHPNFQGRGIFKKLTLSLLNYCEQEKVDFVFNTPNKKSKPGYIKMGWRIGGKLPVILGVKKSFHMIYNMIGRSLPTKFISLPNNYFSIKSAIENFDFSQISKTDQFITGYSKEYLIWRYSHIPVITYYGLGDINHLIIFRLKQSVLGVELRIVDCLGDRFYIQKSIKEVLNNLTFDYVSVSGFSVANLPLLLKTKANFGPDVTIRPLYRQNINEFVAFKNWKPSLGDLEVF